MNRIDFERYIKPTSLRPNDPIGDGITFSFDGNSAMSIVATTEQFDETERLIIRCNNRHSDDWLGLEITVPDDAIRLDLKMRYVPSERIYPRIYFTSNGSEHSLDEPDRAAPATYSSLRFDTDKWRKMADVSTMTNIKLALLLPARPWFALGLEAIDQVTHA